MSKFKVGDRVTTKNHAHLRTIYGTVVSIEANSRGFEVKLDEKYIMQDDELYYWENELEIDEIYATKLGKILYGE